MSNNLNENASTLLSNLTARLSNIELEKSILAHCINLKEDQIEIMIGLDAKYFFNMDHQELFQILFNMFIDRMNISMGSVISMIQLKVKKRQADTLIELVQSLSSITLKDTVFNSIFIIKEVYRNRIIYSEVFVRASSMFQDNEPIENIITHITEAVLSVEVGKKEIDVENTVDNVVDSIMNSVQDEVGLDTGLNEFDLHYGGVKPDRYITIAAESGSGKTAILIDLIERLCVRHSEKIQILFFSLEMSEQRIIKRLISRKTDFSVQKLEQKIKHLNKEEKAIVAAAGKSIGQYPLEIIYDTMNCNQIKMRVKRMVMENPDKHLIVMIDHIGLVEGETNDMRVNTIKASTMAKSLCRNHGCTTIVLSQFTKEIDNADNKKNFHRPHMGYIMESGRIRQDSDIVILGWRPETRFPTIPYAGIPDWNTNGKYIMLNEKNRDGQAPTDMILEQKIATNKFFNTNDSFS